MEDKIKNYEPLDHDLFIEESLINGQGLFASKDIPEGTNLGISHIEIEKDKMSPKEIIRTPLGGFINHSNTPNCDKAELRMTNEDLQGHQYHYKI